MQHNRTEAWGRYLPVQRLAGITVVLIRDSRALARVRELYPQAQLYLWVHDQLNPGSKRARRLAASARLLREAPCASCASRIRSGAAWRPPCARSAWTMRYAR